MHPLQKKLTIAYVALLITWTLIAYSTFAVFLSQGTMFARKLNGEVALTDFVNFYNAALLTRQCLTNKVDIYDPAVQAASQESITAPLKPDLPFYMHYPPYFYPLVLPLAAFDISTAWCVWSFLGAVALLCSIKYLSSDLVISRWQKTLAFTSVIVSYPVWLSFGMGQTSLFTTAAMVTFWHSLRRNQHFKAGIASAFVAVKLQYMPVIGLVGLVTGRAWFLAGLSAVMLLLFLPATLTTIGLQNVLAFPHSMVHETSTKVGGVSPASMQNIRGYLTLILHKESPVVVYTAGIMMIIAATTIAAAWSLKPICETRWQTLDSERMFKFMVSLTIPLMLVTSLHSQVYDYVMMTIPCIWLWGLTSVYGGRNKTALCLRALILCYPPVSWIGANAHTTLDAMFIQPGTIWALAVFIAAATIFWQELSAANISESSTAQSD